MSIPLVSIVIPCYRQGRFLAAAVESALGQSYPAVEVVVVNDGSDDETDAVARSFGSRITYVAQPNRGLSAARNAGVAVATGDYLLVLDSDDTIHPDSVGWLVGAAAGRDRVLCAMGFQAFDADGGAYPELSPARHPRPEVELLTENLGPPHTYLSSRVMVAEAGGFDVRLKSCEDWDMWLRLVFAGAEVVPVDRIGARYRVHPQSMSRNQARMAETRAEVLRRVLNRTGADPVLAKRLGAESRRFPADHRRRIAAEHLDAAYHFREQGRYARAVRHYVLGLRWGGSARTGLGGICKLLPHRAWNALGRAR